MGGEPSETFLSDYHGRAVSMTARTGAGRGTADSWRSGMTGCATSAHTRSAAGPLTNTFNAALMATGAYHIPAVYGRNRLAVTNTVPITAYRGAGRPDMAYIVERLVDEAARQTGIDRIALRRRNLICRRGFSLPDRHRADAERLRQRRFRRPAGRGGGRGGLGRVSRRGVRRRPGAGGCAASAARVFIEPAGGVAPTDEAALTFEPDGSSCCTRSPSLRPGPRDGAAGDRRPAFCSRPAADYPARRAGPDGPALKGGGAFGSRSMMSQGSVSASRRAAWSSGRARRWPRQPLEAARSGHRLRRRRLPHRGHRPVDRPGGARAAHSRARSTAVPSCRRRAPSPPAPMWPRWRSTRRPA